MADGVTESNGDTAGEKPGGDVVETGARPPGRPTVWTADVERNLFYALRLGVSRNKSARYAGIHPDTFWDRLKRDPVFSEKVHAEESAGIVSHAERMATAEAFGKAAGAVVNASRFYLATHDREAWREEQTINHGGTLSIAGLALQAAKPPEEPNG